MIIIVDFGSQTTHLIGRRIRDFGILSEIVEPSNAFDLIRKNKPDGVILSGGPASVYEKGAPLLNKKIFELNIPILGICYGWQLMAKQLGGSVVSGNKEYGPAELEILLKDSILKGINKRTQIWMSHGDTVTLIPEGFKVIGRSDAIDIAVTENKEMNFIGLQFHPEVEHTEFGTKMLRNFVTNICDLKIKKSKKIDIDELVSNIDKVVGKNKVICAVSGGVDSTVAAYLIGKAIGSQLYPIFVESGLNRVGTKELVLEIFRDLLGIPPIIIHAEEEFLLALKGVSDSELKRKIIGKLYVDLFAKEAKKIKNVKFLAQGTIYSDVIESQGSKHSSKIKSHHNVGGLPKNMKFNLLEPVRNFYKDEVKEIGINLGIPEHVVYQQKFPGPGHAIRIMGAITKERLEMERKADSIVVEELKKAKIFKKCHESFAVMTNAFSTAVKGDGRFFGEVVAIRAISSTDIMTGDWVKIPFDVLQRMSSRIVNEVPNVSRVVYDITTKPPATMEWE